MLCNDNESGMVISHVENFLQFDTRSGHANWQRSFPCLKFNAFWKVENERKHPKLWSKLFYNGCECDLVNARWNCTVPVHHELNELALWQFGSINQSINQIGIYIAPKPKENCTKALDIGYRVFSRFLTGSWLCQAIFESRSRFKLCMHPNIIYVWLQNEVSNRS